MESKKINQLATELAPVLSDLTIIGDPTTGISRKITLSQMASLFTGTVEEYPNLASFPLVGTADTIYIALDTNIIYRWNTGTNAYVELSPNIVTSLVFNDANGFDGTINLVGSTATLTITTALTQGSVPFIGTSGALTQDNANLFFDDTNNRLGINTNAPTTALDVFGSGIIGRLNGTSTNNAFLGFANAGTNRWSIGNVQSDHRFRIFSETNTSELVTVLQTGEFGIGIANPTTKLHIDGGATALIANLDANVSVAKSISFRSDNSNRINIEVSGTESGSNAGANFFIRRYSDAGSLIDTPLTITRSTGAITLAGALIGTSATFSGRLSATGNDYHSLIVADGSAQLRLERTGGSAGFMYLGADSGGFKVINSSLTNLLTITSVGNSKFIGDIELNGGTGTRTLTIQSNTSGDAVLALLAAGSNGGSITYKRSTSEIIFNNNSIDVLKISGQGALQILANNLLNEGAAAAIIRQNGANNNNGLLVDVTNSVNAYIADFRQGNSSLVRIIGNGNLGIGIDNPGFRLHVLATTASIATFGTSSASGGFVGFRYNTSTVFGYIGNGNQLVTGGGVADIALTSESANILFATNGGAERARITSGGNFGISTSSPITTFQIRNNHWQQYIQKSITSQTNFISVNLRNNGAAIINVTSSAFRPGVDTYAQTIQYFVICRGEALTVNTSNNFGQGIVLFSVSGSTITLAFGYAGGSTNFQNAFVSIQGVSQNNVEESIIVTLL